jgi:UDP-2,3-diacylglucosamine pyrophosphatase LpxH
MVSDLHLGTGVGRRGTGEAFVELLDAIADTRPEADRHLVLLGDTFDLPGDDGAAARLEALAVRHPGVLAALRHALATGTHLEVVCGNHDAALARPAVQAALRRLLTPPPRSWPAPQPGTVRVHPWMLHVRGVFHAEHGHQHHDVHRLPTLLSQPSSAGPMGSPLSAWTGSAGAGRLGRLDAARRAVRAVRRAERLATAPAYLALVDAEAARTGLPVDAGRALARTSRFRTLPAAVDVTRRVAARRMGSERPGAGLRRAAARVHAVLDEHGAAVPAVVFGHAHRAERDAIAGTSACYLNTGTWSDDVRGHGPDQRDDRLFPYVRIDATSGGGVVTTQASLRYWSSRSGPEPRVSGARRREPARRG